jgi:hypothetical protein
VVWSVVAAAPGAAIAIDAIVPSGAAIVVDAIVPSGGAIVVDAVVPDVVAHLMLALLVVRWVIAAAARLRDGRHRDGTGDGKRSQGFRVACMHVGVPPRGGCHLSSTMPPHRS